MADPQEWPEGRRVAQLYAEAYDIPLPTALDLVFGGEPAGGWISGPCRTPDYEEDV